MHVNCMMVLMMIMNCLKLKVCIVLNPLFNTCLIGVACFSWLYVLMLLDRAWSFLFFKFGKDRFQFRWCWRVLFSMTIHLIGGLIFGLLAMDHLLLFELILVWSLSVQSELTRVRFWLKRKECHNILLMMLQVLFNHRLKF